MERYNTDIKIGLSEEQVRQRRKDKLTNKVKNKNEKTYLKIVLDNLFTFFNVIMVTLAVVLINIVGPKILTNLSFLVILFLNTVIGIYQECKCKYTLKKLKLLHTSKVEVIRNGKSKEILPEEICLDDILVLKPGDQVPADCIVLKDGEYEVNESLMTGESNSIKKVKGDLLLAGSYIVTGKCYVRAEKVGKQTYLYSIENKAKGYKKPKSMLIKALNKIIKLLVLIAIPLGLIVGWNELLRNGFELGIKWGSLAIIYMVPAGMILLASVSMILSVIKLANRKTLTQDIYSVESLSRIDTLCLDKTGTLTDGTLTVEKVIFYNKDLENNGIISSYLSAFDTENQTSQALIRKFTNKREIEIKNIIEFSSERKYSAVEFEKEGTYVLGAPEYLTTNKEVLDLVKEYTKKGLRVIILTKTNQNLNKKELKILSDCKQVMAMFILRDNIREGVQDTIKWFSNNEVAIRVISGDNVNTVSHIAKECGIKNWDKYIDLSTVKKEEFREQVLKNYIYGRVTPEQKAEIVDILKEEKHIVGMTGDGVNDVISLKKADCSIALGNGAPATKNVSNFILLDNNFNNMKDAVYEGRRVINNVQRSSSLFIMKDILWMFMMIIPLIFNISHIYEATTISLINWMVTGLGSFCLTIEPNSERIKGDFFKTVLTRALISGVYMCLPILFVHVYSFISCGVNPSAVESLIREMMPIASICVTISGFVIFFNMCKPFTSYRRILYIVTLILTILLLLAIPDFFLMNGTEHLQHLIDYGDVWVAIKSIITNVFSLTIYKDFNLHWWLIIGIYLIFSSFLYILTDKFITRLLNHKVLREDDGISSFGEIVDKIKQKIIKEK